ncbi:MAG: hydantoinase/oxoprolinase family protein [Methylococcales bacterium]|nr:H4MPT-linked C1 transfer pathway protein [Methylococcaceae bacterium]
MQIKTIGWDIGGAHVKAALLNEDGEIISVYQVACPLWKGLDQLHIAVNSVLEQIPDPPILHAITMTGELVDLFDNRDEGVNQIINTMQALLPDAELQVFAGYEGLIEANNITPQHYSAIASANWLASALFSAQKVGNGLFVDIGSTTTDILLLDDHRVLAEGYSDYQRLITQELVYTGVVRTAVMAVAQSALDKEQEIGLMAEYFATMADVYRLTGELDENHDQTDTADGAEKTVFASAKRLARMIGCDFYPEELARWQQLAFNIRGQQLQKIQAACQRRLAWQGKSKDRPIIGAGIGRFLVRQVALSLEHPYIDFAELLTAPKLASSGMSTADCAPAVAVACLASRCAN